MPPVIIAAPRLRKRPRGLLLDVAEPITEGEMSRFAGGVTFCPQGCANLSAYEDLFCDEVQIPSAGPTTPEAETFHSFTVVGREDAPERFEKDLATGRIIQRFDTQISAQVARELATGAETAGPSLQSEATVTVTGVALEDAIYVIDDLLSEVDNAQGTILATPATFGSLVNSYDVTEDGGVYQTPTGHFLVGDSGFDGAGQDGEVDAGFSWVYAIIGVPRFWLGERRQLGTESARFDMSRNSYATVFAQDALVAFENCLVAAVQVDVPNYTAGS